VKLFLIELHKVWCISIVILHITFVFGALALFDWTSTAAFNSSPVFWFHI